MATHSAPKQEDWNLDYVVGLLSGGLVLGFGIRSLFWSFGWSGGECLNCDLARVGYDGIDNLSLLPAADYSIGLVVLGVMMLITLNATAWRRTGGY
jgi:hypothetical protein